MRMLLLLDAVAHGSLITAAICVVFRLFIDGDSVVFFHRVSCVSFPALFHGYIVPMHASTMCIFCLHVLTGVVMARVLFPPEIVCVNISASVCACVCVASVLETANIYYSCYFNARARSALV